MGKISYSLYLWHWPVVVFANYGRFEPLSFTEKVALVVLSLALAVLTWRFVEQPIRQGKFMATRQSIAAGTVLATVAMIVVTVALVRFEGLPHRVQPELVSRWQPERAADPERGCHAVTPARASVGDVCVRGAANVSPSFVLVGDSHAHALSPGVFAAAERLGIAGAQFTGPGFIPTPGRYRIGSVMRTEVSDARVEALLSFLERRPEIEVVIVTGWWHRYVTGYSYREQNAVWRDLECEVHSRGQCNAISLKRSLIRLGAALDDRTLVFLDDVPVGWELHPDSHFRAAFIGRAGRAPEIPRSVALRQFGAYSGILQEVADSRSNVKFWPILFERLCESSCSALGSNGELVFNDGDHLSRYGAGLLVADLEDIFLRLQTGADLFDAQTRVSHSGGNDP